MAELGKIYGEAQSGVMVDNTFWQERAKANRPVAKPDHINRKDSFWYLCTPYSKYLSKEVEEGVFSKEWALTEAYEMASEMLMYLEQKGLFVYCPIVHSHTPAKYGDKDLAFNHDFWLNVDFKFIYMSRGLIITKMKGWDKSYGIGKEIEYAGKLELPVYYTNFIEFPQELL